MRDNSFFIKLTLATHRVAELLPQKEPVRLHIERAANTLLVLLLEQKSEGVQKAIAELGNLMRYFQEARTRNLMNPDNFRILEKEYNKVEGLFTGLEKHERIPERTHNLSSRQQKIVEFLKYKDKAQVWEFKRILPEVTKRTLRRDLDDLLQKGLVAREGEWNAIFYRLPRQEQERNVEKV